MAQLTDALEAYKRFERCGLSTQAVTAGCALSNQDRSKLVATTAEVGFELATNLPIGFPFKALRIGSRVIVEGVGQQASSQIPNESKQVIGEIVDVGVIVQSGVKGGSVPRQFENDGRNGSSLLPTRDADDNPIQYREWGTVPSPGQNGGERIVTGSDGSVYYSPDHYKTFIRER